MTRFAPLALFEAPRTLSPELVTHLRQRLETQRDFRVQQLAELAGSTIGVRWGAADIEIRASLAAGARAALGEVRSALRRIEQGSYGRCTRCGMALDVGRLELVPHTAHCTDCLPGA